MPEIPRMLTPPLAIRCRNLVKRYDGRPPVEAVRGLDLEIAQGECFGLLGPNGAGKTTTIEILEGLLPATSGEVEVLGLAWGRADNEIRQRIGISLQETRLSEKLTVLETLTLFRSFYRQGLDPADALARVSLEDKANAWVGKISGGQKQRLAVASALVGDPELLFLDEPTTGLDPQSRRQLWEIIREIRAAGRTVLLTTHYMDEAERLCDRVAIIDLGRIIALGTPRELILSLGGEHVIEFALETDQGQAAPERADLAELPGVTRRGHGERQYSLERQRAARGAAGAVGSAVATKPRAQELDDAACQPGRRVRQAGGAASRRRTESLVMKTTHRPVTTEKYSPLWQIVLSRVREFYREPEALFWVYGFPILLVVGLGIAFRNQPIEKIAVDIQAGPSAQSLVERAGQTTEVRSRCLFRGSSAAAAAHGKD